MNLAMLPQRLLLSGLNRSRNGASMRALFIAALLAAAVMPSAYAAEGDAAAATKPPETTATVTNAPEAPKPPNITVLSANRREIVETLIVSGTFMPREEILVQPEVDGQAVVEILAEEGDTVIKGQPLARLSASSVEVLLAQSTASLARSDASISQAKAQIAEAEASLNDSKSSLERTRALRRNGVSTVEQLDQRQTAFNAATARLNSAKQLLAIAEADKKATEAQRQELNLRMARTEIRAPASGVISRRTIRIGSIASMQVDAMFRIIEDGAIELMAEVTEGDLPRLANGQKVAISAPGLDGSIEGSVRLIAPEVSNITRLGTMRVALPKDARVKIGAFGRGIVEIARSSGIALPMPAVTFHREGANVHVVANGKVSLRKVTTGLVGEGMVEIREGLKEGESVVARAGTFLRDGDIVTPVAAKAEVK
jgi:HlyD family secretion protein